MLRVIIVAVVLGAAFYGFGRYATEINPDWRSKDPRTASREIFDWPDILRRRPADAQTAPQRPAPRGRRTPLRFSGYASYYAPSLHGNLTASGEVYVHNGMTAAHKTLPFNTRVLVTRRDTGDVVMVRINDRGPFIAGRAIDLSRAAAQRIGLSQRGHARVQLDIVAP